MISPIGKLRISGGNDAPPRAFTLIELILVMAMLVVVLAVAAPALAHFFRGRSLDSEARRFLALTRYGQNRAVTDGMPYLLWIDASKRAYGLMPETSEDEQFEDEFATDTLEYQLARDIHLEVELPLAGPRWLASDPQLPTTATDSIPWKRTLQLVGNLPTIRFTPDAFVSETSPEYVMLREGETEPASGDAAIWIGRNRNRCNYEIWTNPPAILVR